MKKLLSVWLCFTMIFCSSMIAGAKEDSVKVVVDGKELSQTGVIVKDRTLVPMRAICEAMGVSVDWSDQNKVQTVTIGKDLTEKDAKIAGANHVNYQFTIGSASVVNLNNHDTIPLKIAPQIIDGKAMLPARDMADILGCQTTWNAAEKTAQIQTVSRQYCIWKDGELRIITKYSAQNDFFLILKKKGVNQLFDFYSGGLVPNQTLGVKTALSDQKVLFANNNDWFGAFTVLAKNQADGDDKVETWTGGAHSYQNTQQGNPTARCTSLQVWIDGKETTQYEGYFDQLKIKWSNNVQASNTKKLDGTGREVLTETHEMDFDGQQFNVSNDIAPLEDVFIRMYYGFQCCLPGYTGMLTYYGSNDTKDNTVSAADKTQSTMHDCQRANAVLNGNAIEVGIDTSFGLGTRTLTDASYPGMFCDGSKIRTHMIHEKDLSKGEHYYSKGYFKFYADQTK